MFLSQSQYPYNPATMCISTPELPASLYRYPLSSPQSASEHSSPSSSPMFTSNQLQTDSALSALELLMEITPFPPSMPNLAKPTCPEYDVLPSPQTPQSQLPSILLNEQSLDCLQQFYQQQDNHQQPQQQQPTPASSDLTDASSVSSPASSIYSVSPTLRSVSPPPSPFSMATSPYDATLESWMSPQQPSVSYQQQQQQQQQHHNHHHHHHHQSQPADNFSLFGNSLPIEPYFGWNHHQQQQQASSMYKIQSSTASHRRCSSLSSNNSSNGGNNNNNNNNMSSQQQQLYRERRASSTSACESSSSSSSSSSPMMMMSNPRASISSISSISSIVSSVSATSSPTSPRVKSYPCPTCTKPFPTRTQLKSHMAIHTDFFPFPCQHEGCDLHFKRKHDLRRHVDAKHALVKKYLCTAGCGEGFGRRDQMVRHLRRGTCQSRHVLPTQA
ncbi:hypothetical protein DFQ26_002558 [Actinomortierella ambigua]|nr:hypothetical protein DFQ26_002558 [Actinomortierella ambigua]